MSLVSAKQDCLLKKIKRHLINIFAFYNANREGGTYGCLGYPVPGPHTRLPAPIKFQLP